MADKSVATGDKNEFDGDLSGDGDIMAKLGAPSDTAWGALSLHCYVKTTGLSEAQLADCDKQIANIREQEERCAKMKATVNEVAKPAEGKSGKPKVFVRVRPVSSEEKKTSEDLIDGLAIETDVAEDGKSVQAMATAGQAIAGLLGPKSNNEETFKLMLHSHLETVLSGGSVSVFAYGHSGTGKTHTTLGYRAEPGLFKLACEEIFRVIAEKNKELNDDRLMLQVRFSELHLGRAYDLLNKRAQLMLREDDKGEVHLRAQTVFHEDGRAETRDQQFVHVKDLYHLLEILDDGIKMRAVGSSNIHDQSSRSHAMLEMELVSEKLVQAREDLIVARGNLVPLDQQRQILDKRCAALLYYDPNGDKPMEGSEFESGGDTSLYEVFFVEYLRLSYMISIGQASRDALDNLFLRHCDAGFKDEAQFMAYIKKIGAYKTIESYWEGMKDWWTQEGWLKGHAALAAELDSLHKKYAEEYPKIQDALDRIKAVQKEFEGKLGGMLCLVDLAGADHDTRDLSAATKQELAESAQINSELATLKGVMSGLAKKKGRLPWRDQKLTMVLKRVLAPPAGGDSQALMIACISPSITQERDTLNTLHYAQMVAGAPAKSRAAPAKRKPIGRRQADPATVKQIREIYKEHCPDKTEADVDGILKKFAGREQILLSKMKAKYVVNKPKEDAPMAEPAEAAAEPAKAPKEDAAMAEPAQADAAAKMDVDEPKPAASKDEPQPTRPATDEPKPKEAASGEEPKPDTSGSAFPSCMSKSILSYCS